MFFLQEPPLEKDEYANERIKRISIPLRVNKEKHFTQ